MVTKEKLKLHTKLKQQLSSLEEKDPLLKYDLTDPKELRSAKTEVNAPEAEQSTQDLIQTAYTESLNKLIEEIASSNSEIEDLNEKYEKFEEKSKKLTEDYKKLEEDNETLSKDFGILKKEFSSSRASNTEALVVFVAFFTIVAVNITIYTKVEYLSSALWFMFLMTVCMTIVVLVFSMLVRNEATPWKLKLTGFLVISIIVSLIYLNHSYNQNDIIINPRPDPTATPVPPTIVPTITPTPTLIFPLRRLTPTG